MPTIHIDPATLLVADAPSHGNACHNYEIRDADTGELLGSVHFQEGPIAEHGRNGVQHADLLAIVLHRLDAFQSGPFASAVNEVTAGYVAAAIASEGTRTRRRRLAGVEGTGRKAPGVEA